MTVVSHFHARLNMLVCNYDNDQSFSFKNKHVSCKTKPASFIDMTIISNFHLRINMLHARLNLLVL